MIWLADALDALALDRWLNVWCIRHAKLEKLQEFRSRHRIGWFLQNFREMCVSRSLTFHLETKMLWHQSPSWKNKATLTMSAYQDQLNAGFSKVCEIFKVRCIECLKYVQEFYNPVCYCGDISTPLNITWHKTKHNWLLYLSVSHMASWAGFGHSKRPKFPDLLPLVWRSGYTRLGWHLHLCLKSWTFFNFCHEQHQWCYATIQFWHDVTHLK